MQIGSLADWFTGAATFAAVLTTLLFNFFERRRAAKQSIYRAKTAMARLSLDVIRQVNGLTDSVSDGDSLSAIHTMRIYVFVLTLIGNQQVSELLEASELFLVTANKTAVGKTDKSELKEAYDQLVARTV
ncbi:MULTISPECIES: hypothetical protein [Furfurilactobacillus]|jgi:hypothetical protein|uniref:Uncharacterized protein n=2 Tax=Furfurilactobacillus TaxID=2767882 RepID=A0ABT6DA34_9LACO|nr:MULTISPECIES: hypothetical protein [Furfurilactobacillus]QLE65412.1 hypothetical protein LROSL2_0059 [Furfurilactobacillus rossiae]MCF6160910.1 hypothetical protein [Furfurilactobacillus milii]MCF6163324.1 hypothetical protein [Furfurilactobacillus milii]MCH4011932.1 hypothetical protein [Furfurilactobacillus sp.]MCH4037824.1 hypothetical protein [Furfurilactobacillus sp.]